jgi:hypothetical protein
VDIPWIRAAGEWNGSDCNSQVPTAGQVGHARWGTADESADSELQSPTQLTLRTQPGNDAATIYTALVAVKMQSFAVLHLRIRGAIFHRAGLLWDGGLRARPLAPRDLLAQNPAA